ncbi:MAG: histidine phosphatase family protein [Desulfobacteraceae bacterium]|nr:MAG: histidine phosphatase family protein [Desulfobacteraceae bacterium]
MKTIYLVRHAKSSWKYPELDDFERPLNKRGRRNAVSIGKYLDKIKAAPGLLISSPAARAAMTARIIAAAINYPIGKIQYSETIYSPGKEDLLHITGNISDEIKEAMLIGHNPVFTDFANYIGNQQITNIPTCGVFCAELDISSWSKIAKNCGVLKFFEFPENHA